MEMKHVNFVISPGQKRFPIDLYNMKLYYYIFLQNVEQIFETEQVRLDE